MDDPDPQAPRSVLRVPVVLYVDCLADEPAAEVEARVLEALRTPEARALLNHTHSTAGKNPEWSTPRVNPANPARRANVTTRAGRVKGDT